MRDPGLARSASADNPGISPRPAGVSRARPASRMAAWTPVPSTSAPAAARQVLDITRAVRGVRRRARRRAAARLRPARDGRHRDPRDRRRVRRRPARRARRPAAGRRPVAAPARLARARPLARDAGARAAVRDRPRARTAGSPSAPGRASAWSTSTSTTPTARSGCRSSPASRRPTPGRTRPRGTRRRTARGPCGSWRRRRSPKSTSSSTKPSGSSSIASMIASSVWKSTRSSSLSSSETQWILAVARPSSSTTGSISSGSVISAQSRSASYGDTSATTYPTLSTVVQPRNGSVCTCSSRWLTTVRWPSFSKKLGGALVVDDAADGRDVALLHRQHDVVLERLVEALDQDVVRRQAGRADAEPGLPDDVLDVVEDRLLLALGVGERLEVALEGALDLAALGLAELAHAGAADEPALVVDDLGHVVEQLDAGAHAGRDQDLLDRRRRCCRGAGRTPRPRRPSRSAAPGRRTRRGRSATARGCPPRAAPSASPSGPGWPGSGAGPSEKCPR